MNILSRQINRAILAPIAALLIFCSTEIHAAWDMTFPFYHEEQTLPAPQNTAPSAAPLPVVVQPVPAVAPLLQEPQITLPEKPVGTKPEPLPSQPSPPIVIIHPPETAPPTDTAVPPSQGDRSAPFADALRISGTVYREDIQWQEKVQLDGWVTVAPQATLTIAPGTTVRMSPGCGIHVLGRIVVKGMAENPVLIASLSREPLPGEWRGIVLSGSEKKNILQHLRIEGAETALLARFSAFSARDVTISSAITGLHLQESVVSLKDARFNDNGSGIVADNSELTLDAVRLENNRNGITLNASSLMASDITLTGNKQSGLTAEGAQLKLERFIVSGSETGARITRGEGTISLSIFRNNSEAGAVLSASRIKLNGNRFSGNRIGLQIGDHLPVLWDNALVDNKSYNLLYLGEEIFYAGGNWFGTGSNESSEKTVFSKHSGAVQTEPLLKADPLAND
ncbi:MAG TPA: right-handed parallel beta-helix repeat-containing protein [Geobacteraceae bacterium]|nr:right-handed parallel beta-helix repeat-containing protein [Geobacteraceae bacterium]